MAHPFLDGNGRTLMEVHADLAHCGRTFISNGSVAAVEAERELVQVNNWASVRNPLLPGGCPAAIVLQGTLFDARLAEVLRGPRLALMRPAGYGGHGCPHSSATTGALRLNGYPELPYLAAPTHELERSGKAFDQFVAPFVRPGAISLSDTADRLSRNPGLGPPGKRDTWRAGEGCGSALPPAPVPHRQRALPFRHGSHREDRPGHRRACHRCGDGFRRGLIVWPVASPPPQAELTKAPGTLGVASPAYLPVEGALHRQAFRTGRFMEAGSRSELRAGPMGRRVAAPRLGALCLPRRSAW